jgi:tetratricopeptide (TPR) repeat protein
MLSAKDYCHTYSAHRVDYLGSYIFAPCADNVPYPNFATCLEAGLGDRHRDSARLLEQFVVLHQAGFSRNIQVGILDKDALEFLANGIYFPSTPPSHSSDLHTTLSDIEKTSIIEAYAWDLFPLLIAWAYRATSTKPITSNESSCLVRSALDAMVKLDPVTWVDGTIQTRLEPNRIFVHWFVLACEECGWWTEVQTIWTQVVADRQQEKGSEHHETLSATASLAVAYQRQGMIDKAKALQLEVLKVRPRDLGQEHPDTLSVMHDLAQTLLAGGGAEVADAEDRLLRVFELRRILLGDCHPETLSTLHDLALAYSKQHRWRDAADLNEKVLKARRHTLKKDHPDILSSLHNLAWSRLEGGWSIEATAEFHLSVLKTRNIEIGATHPDTLHSMVSLARVYEKQGRWEEATNLKTSVLETQKRLFGNEHPMTLLSMLDMASWYEKQGCRTEVIALREKVLDSRKRVLGLDHPDTMLAAGALVSTYWQQGRWKEAETLHQGLVETKKEVLGDDHPETLEMMLDLATHYSQQFQWKSASELLLDVRGGMTLALPRDDPQILSVVSWLPQRVRVFY